MSHSSIRGAADDGTIVTEEDPTTSSSSGGDIDLIFIVHATFIASIVMAVLLLCYLNFRDTHRDAPLTQCLRQLCRVACCGCLHLSDFVNDWSIERGATNGYDGEYFQRRATRIEAEKEAWKERPEETEARLKRAFERGGMVWVSRPVCCVCIVVFP